VEAIGDCGERRSSDLGQFGSEIDFRPRIERTRDAEDYIGPFKLPITRLLSRLKLVVI